MLAVVAGLYLWLNLESLTGMAAIWWRSDTYAHGMLVPLISGWLIYRQRGRLANTPVHTCWWGLLPLGGALLLWMIARAADVQAAEQLASVAMAISLVLLLGGWRFFCVVMFPLFYLFFAVPLGEELTPWLQQVTADISVRALQLTGIPVYVNGLFIEIPSGRFEVAEACSGIRYLIASLAVGTLYAYLTYQSLGKRLLFVFAAFVTPIIANGIRAYLIIIIAHLSSMKYATGVDHLIYGWLFFGLVMLALFWIGSFWADSTNAQTAPNSPAPEAAGLPASPAVLLTILLLITTMALDSRTLEAAAPAGGTYELELPGWTRVQVEGDWSPQFANPDFSLLRHYSGPAAVSIYIADYHQETQDKELINQLNRFYDDDWTLAQHRVIDLGNDSPPTQVNQLDIRHSGGERRLVWYWYQVDDRTARRGTLVKLYQALARIGGRSPFSRVVAVSTKVDEVNDQQASQRLQQLIDAAWPALATLR
nr:exosortase A [Motiliproteus sediminis]